MYCVDPLEARSLRSRGVPPKVGSVVNRALLLAGEPLKQPPDSSEEGKKSGG